MIAGEVETKLINIIRNQDIDLPDSLEQLDPNLNLAELGINSIVFIDIVIALEAEFNLEFGDEELNVKDFPTLESLISYIKRKLG